MDLPTDPGQPAEFGRQSQSIGRSRITLYALLFMLAGVISPVVPLRNVLADWLILVLIFLVPMLAIGVAEVSASRRRSAFIGCGCLCLSTTVLSLVVLVARGSLGPIADWYAFTIICFGILLYTYNVSLAVWSFFRRM